MFIYLTNRMNMCLHSKWALLSWHLPHCTSCYNMSIVLCSSVALGSPLNVKRKKNEFNMLPVSTAEVVCARKGSFIFKCTRLMRNELFKFELCILLDLFIDMYALNLITVQYLVNIKSFNSS